MLDVRFVWKSGSAKISVSDVGYGFRLEPASYGSAMKRTVLDHGQPDRLHHKCNNHIPPAG